MRHSILRVTCAVTLAVGFALISARLADSSSQQSEQPPSQQTSPPQQGSPPALQAQPAASGRVIVLDPAHGGTDTGARGGNGLTEKDVVLQLARTIREQLAQKGYRVVLTRNDDSNPSYDDRAGIANAYRDEIFISLHVSSTGTSGTVRAYFDEFSTPITDVSAPAGAPGAKSAAPQPRGSLVSWDEAQRPYVEASHHLADLIQLQLAQNFPGSPTVSTGAAIRTLRSVTAPAVAIEISSVGSPADALTGSGAPIAAAIGAGISTLGQGMK